MPDKTLSIWTVYDHPSDYPDGFIARRWAIVDGREIMTDDTIEADDLETLRRHFEERTLCCLPREPDDDPVIVECWI
jgi:hypothetical protein